MKRFHIFYYLLFIVLVMGAFASMAQNSYGLRIMGIVSFVFSLLFLVQLVVEVRRKGGRDMMAVAELAGLFVLSGIIGMRIFYIHFPYVELLFSGGGLLLAWVYLKKAEERYRETYPKSRVMAMFVVAFHAGIVAFLLSLVLVPFSPRIAVGVGIIALVLLAAFAVGSIFRKRIMVEGDTVSPVQSVFRYKDHSVVLVSVLLLYTLYAGLNKIGVLPSIYQDKYPKAFYDLADRAATGKEKAVDGRYQYDLFKEEYEKMVRRNSSSFLP